MLFYVENVRSYIAEYNTSLPPPLTPAERIADVVPEQKLGPAKFQVSEGVLRVQHQAALAGAADLRNAEAASEELIRASGEIIRFLESANHDPRLTSTITDIQHRLAIKQDIIQLGIASISAQLVCDQFENELPDVWTAKLRAFSMGVGMYVSQFSEWIRFSENAAMAEFSPADVRKLYSSGTALVDGLRRVGPSVDPEVPQTLSFLLELINDPRKAVRRTTLAAARSIENLVVVVARSFGGILKAVPDGAAEGVKLATKYTTAIVLLALAAQAAIDIGPATGKALHASWMHKAGEIIQEGLKDIK